MTHPQDGSYQHWLPAHPNDEVDLQPEDPNPPYGYPGYDYAPSPDPRYAVPYGYPPASGQPPTRRNPLAPVIGGLVLVIAIVIGAILLSGGGNGPAAGNGFPATPTTGAATGGGLSCSEIAQTPTLSGAFDNLQPTTETPPSSIPLPAAAPTVSCVGDLQFTDGSQDPAQVYDYADTGTSAYEPILAEAGWTESAPATIDQPAIWDLDSSDYEIDLVTFGRDLIVIIDDAESSPGPGSGPSGVTPS
jgi:hypothetical protein